MTITIDPKDLARAIGAATAGKHPDGHYRIGGGAVACLWGDVASVRVVLPELDDMGERVTAALPTLRSFCAAQTAPVTLDVSDPDRIVARSGGRQCTIRAAAPDDPTPDAPFTSDGPSVPLRSLAQVAHAASSDTTRATLCGVWITPDLIGASDSYIAAWADTEAHAEPTIVPAAAVVAAARVCDLDIARVHLNGHYGAVITEGSGPGSTTMHVRTIEGDPPNVRQLLPPAPPARIHVDRMALIDALKLCAEWKRPSKGEPAKLANVVELRAAGGTLTVATAATTELPTVITSDVDIELEGVDDYRVGINAGALGALLEAVDDEAVTIEAIDDLKPLVIRTDEITQLVMPVRLKR